MLAEMEGAQHESGSIQLAHASVMPPRAEAVAAAQLQFGSRLQDACEHCASVAQR